MRKSITFEDITFKFTRVKDYVLVTFPLFVKRGTAIRKFIEWVTTQKVNFRVHGERKTLEYSRGDNEEFSFTYFVLFDEPAFIEKNYQLTAKLPFIVDRVFYEGECYVFDE